MSFDAILQELPKLENAELSRIRDLLNSIQDQRNTVHMAEMARLIDDKDPTHWITLEELEQKLNLSDDNSAE